MPHSKKNAFCAVWLFHVRPTQQIFCSVALSCSAHTANFVHASGFMPHPKKCILCSLALSCSAHAENFLQCGSFMFSSCNKF
jgi:hypothetical protein